MAPLDPANTARLYIDYTAHGTEHTFVLRKQTPDTMQALVDWTADFLAELSGLFDTTVLFHDARVAAQNSNVTNPVGWSPIAGTGTNAQPTNGRPWFGSFVGRDEQGHRVKFGIYGVALGDDASYRIPSVEYALVAAAVEALNDLQSAPATIVGAKPVWKSYMNVGYNAYWQRKSRRIG